jgi:hypothetical protein
MTSCSKHKVELAQLCWACEREKLAIQLTELQKRYDAVTVNGTLDVRDCIDCGQHWAEFGISSHLRCYTCRAKGHAEKLRMENYWLKELLFQAGASIHLHGEHIAHDLAECDHVPCQKIAKATAGHHDETPPEADPFIACHSCGAVKLCKCGHPVAMHRPNCFWIGMCRCTFELEPALIEKAVELEKRSNIAFQKYLEDQKRKGLA